MTIFGGLISATLLDTVLTPVLLFRYGRKPLERLLEAQRSRAETAKGPRSAEAF